jgi:GntR family transcriptional repressor for pyruvate dehydrogenase complex
MSIVISSQSASGLAATATKAPAGLQLHAERLSDRLATSIAAMIDGGAVRPGERLPTEQQLAGTYGVSRTVVREAVHQLKSRGLVRSRQGSGVFVAPAPTHQPLAFDPSVLDSMDAVVQVVELRRVLEGEIAALAAARATRAHLQTLRRALAAIEQAETAGHDAVAEDMAFHRAIGEATGNPQFVRLLAFLEQYLREAMRVTKANEARHEEFMQQVRAEHRAIVDAISLHNPTAARKAAIAHLLHGEWRLQAGGVTKARRSTAAAKPR